MIMRMLGAGPIALAMGPGRRPDRRDLDCSWLLSGPTDDQVVEPADDAPVSAAPLRWAAE